MLLDDVLRNFLEKYNLTKSEEPSKRYFIAATPRCGSTLLAKLLGSLDIAGYPGEYLSEDDILFAAASACIDFDIERYMKILERVLQSQNGIFGIKEMYYRFIHHEKMFYLYNYIYIERRNKIEQGVSLFKLTKTGKSHSELEEKKKLHSFDYSFDEISACIKLLCVQNALWWKYFRKKGISPAIIIYEDFIHDISGTVSRILKEVMNISDYNPENIPPPPINKQADGLSEYYYNRYIYELKEKGNAFSKIAFSEFASYNKLEGYI